MSSAGSRLLTAVVNCACDTLAVAAAAGAALFVVAAGLAGMALAAAGVVCACKAPAASHRVPPSSAAVILMVGCMCNSLGQAPGNRPGRRSIYRLTDVKTNDRQPARVGTGQQT